MSLLRFVISPTDTFAERVELYSDVLLCISTIIAVLFIAFEYIAEHLNWPWGERRKKIFAVIVVISLACEVIFEAGSFWYSYKLQDSQASQLLEAAGVAHTAKADASAAESKATIAVTRVNAADDKLNTLAADEGALGTAIEKDKNALSKERTAREAMLSQERPRDITKEQFNKLKSAINGNGKTIYVYMLFDPEAYEYGMNITFALKDVGYNALWVFSNINTKAVCFDKFAFEGIGSTNVTIGGVMKDGDSAELNKLMMALVTSGVTAPGTAYVLDSKDIPLHPAIFVGLKQPAFTEFSARARPPTLERWLKKHPPPWEPN